jgi:ketosteroid isomerase-like protein
MRATLDRYWEATMTHDLERVHGFYHDDAVVEFPQPGERILGKHNIYEFPIAYTNKALLTCL